MSTNRRDFLKGAAGSALGLALAPNLAGAQTPIGVTPLPNASAQGASKPLKILVLGGTSFIGPYQVQYALDRGHTVTLFNRGKTNPQLFPNVEKLIGDRENNLEALKGRTWD